jgi:Tn3 transposase DDE domain
LERAVDALRARGQVIDEDLLQHLSPLGWEHINLTGDYTWRPSDELKSNGYRPLRTVTEGPGSGAELRV